MKTQGHGRVNKLLKRFKQKTLKHIKRNKMLYHHKQKMLIIQINVQKGELEGIIYQT